MKYYKIIKNNTVIDVNNVFLCLSKKHREVLMPCDIRYTQYLQSSDCEQLYRTTWTAEVENDQYNAEFVEAVIIEEEEFLSLQEVLQTKQEIIYEVKDNNIVEVKPQPEEVAPQPEVLDVIAMKRRLVELETLVQELLKK
jgi:hypothetical protein